MSDTVVIYVYTVYLVRTRTNQTRLLLRNRGPQKQWLYVCVGRLTLSYFLNKILVGVYLPGAYLCVCVCVVVYGVIIRNFLLLLRPFDYFRNSKQVLLKGLYIMLLVSSQWQECFTNKSKIKRLLLSSGPSSSAVYPGT